MMLAVYKMELSLFIDANCVGIVLQYASSAAVAPAMISETLRTAVAGN